MLHRIKGMPTFYTLTEINPETNTVVSASFTSLEDLKTDVDKRLGVSVNATEEHMTGVIMKALKGVLSPFTQYVVNDKKVDKPTSGYELMRPKPQSEYEVKETQFESPLPKDEIDKFFKTSIRPSIIPDIIAAEPDAIECKPSKQYSCDYYITRDGISKNRFYTSLGKWFANTFFDSALSTSDTREPDKVVGTSVLVIHKDSQALIDVLLLTKLFLYEPVFCCTHPSMVKNNISIPEEYISLIKYSNCLHDFLVENVFLEKNRCVTLKKDVFMLFQQLMSVSKKNDIESIYDLVLSYANKTLDRKNISKCFNMFIEDEMVRALDSSIQSSSLYDFWIGYLNRLVSKVEHTEFSEALMQLTNTRYVANAMKEMGFTPVRKTQGIFYTGLEAKTTKNGNNPTILKGFGSLMPFDAEEDKYSSTIG